jgi:hypothetical protein
MIVLDEQLLGRQLEVEIVNGIEERSASFDCRLEYQKATQTGSLFFVL